MKIKKNDLLELLDEESLGNLRVVQEKLIDSTRWSKVYKCVIFNQETNKYFDASYSVGATEYQDESPFDSYGENDLIELFEVEPYEVVTIEYRTKENATD